MFGAMMTWSIFSATIALLFSGGVWANTNSSLVDQCETACRNLPKLPVPVNVVVYTNGFYRPSLKMKEDDVATQRQFAEVYWDCPQWTGPGKAFEIAWYISDDGHETNKELFKTQARALNHDIHISSIPITNVLYKRFKKSGIQSAYISCSVRAIASGLRIGDSAWAHSKPVEIGPDAFYSPPSYQYMSFMEEGGNYVDATVDMIRKEIIHLVSRSGGPSLLEYYSADQDDSANLYTMLYRINNDLPQHRQYGPWIYQDNNDAEDPQSLDELVAQANFAQRVQMKHQKDGKITYHRTGDTVHVEIMKNKGKKKEPSFIPAHSRKNLHRDDFEVQGFAGDWLTGKFFVAYANSDGRSSTVAQWSFVDRVLFHTEQDNNIESLLFNPYRNQLYLLVADELHATHKVQRVSITSSEGNAGESLLFPLSFFEESKQCNCSLAEAEHVTSIALDMRRLNRVGGVRYRDAIHGVDLIFGTALGNIYRSDNAGCKCHHVISVPLQRQHAVTVVAVDFDGFYFAQETGPLWVKKHDEEKPDVVMDLYHPQRNESFRVIQVFDSKTFGVTWKPYPKSGECIKLPYIAPTIDPDSALISHNEIIFSVHVEQKREVPHCQYISHPAYFLSIRYRWVGADSVGKWNVFEMAVSKGIPLAGLNSSTVYEIAVTVVNEYGHTPRSKAFTFRTSMSPNVYKALVVAGIVSSGLFLVLLVMVSACLIRRYRQVARAQHFAGVLNESGFNVLNIISARDITVIPNEVLGMGGFGKVVKGIIKEQDKAEQRKVALKSLDQKVPKALAVTDTELDFFTEADALSRLQEFEVHPNVVELLGVCIDSECPYLVMELMESSVRSFVTDIGKGNTRIQLREVDALQIALDTACGMEHIHKQGYIHRDLRAANIFLTSNNPLNFVAKVGDLGLSRDISKLQTKVYQIPQEEVMPLCWMSPETLDRRAYTMESDVWSFGVFCWEMATYGDTPYREFLGAGKLEDMVREWVVNQCGTPGNPNRFHKFYQKVIAPCWAYSSEGRPTFTKLVDLLKTMLEAAGETGSRQSTEADVSPPESEYSTSITSCYPDSLALAQYRFQNYVRSDGDTPRYSQADVFAGAKTRWPSPSLGDGSPVPLRYTSAEMAPDVGLFAGIQNGQGITHKLDEQFLKHEVSEFSME